jgi:hypothetical protein
MARPELESTLHGGALKRDTASLTPSPPALETRARFSPGGEVRSYIHGSEARIIDASKEVNGADASSSVAQTESCMAFA